MKQFMSEEQDDRKLKRQLRQQRKKLQGHDREPDDWDDDEPHTNHRKRQQKHSH